MKRFLLKWSGVADNLRLFLICLLLFVVGAFFSFWTFFPAEVLEQRLVQEISRESGIKMRGDNAAMLVPLGLRLDLTVLSKYPELADLVIEDLRMTPAWASLVTRNQAIAFKGDLAGGQLNSRIARDGDLSLRLREIRLLELFGAEMAYRINGLLTAEFQGENLAAGAEQGQGTFSASIQQASVLGLEQIGLAADFPLGAVQIAGRFSDMRVSLEQLSVVGGALDVTGGGTLLVGPTPERTRLNLNIRLLPTTQTPVGVRDLLSLTGVRPTPDGSYTLQIGGTLARPVIR
ncbi:MAG: type II secretion system protein GspN [Pelovirga sp.]